MRLLHCAYTFTALKLLLGMECPATHISNCLNNEEVNIFENKDENIVFNKSTKCDTESTDFKPEVSDLSISKYDSPKQPLLASFPKNKNKRAFNSKLYKHFNWNEYSIVKDQVYCFVCRHFTSTNGPQFERTFLNKGFNCWQKQVESFKYHEKTNYHKLNFEKSNIIKQISPIGAFSILVDETKDTSKKEQLSFVIRFVDNEFNVFEKALGCYHMVKLVHTMEKLLEVIHCLSCELQNPKILLPAAMDLVDLTRKELTALRSDASYSLLYNKAKTHALSLGITVEEEQERNTRLRRKLHPSKKLEEYYVMSTTGKCESMKSLKVKNFKTEVFYCCIDR
ncbi:hypothetical protein ACI65C_003897 [Semiaphis heraclei]